MSTLYGSYIFICGVFNNYKSYMYIIGRLGHLHGIYMLQCYWLVLFCLVCFWESTHTRKIKKKCNVSLNIKLTLVHFIWLYYFIWLYHCIWLYHFIWLSFYLNISFYLSYLEKLKDIYKRGNTNDIRPWFVNTRLKLKESCYI